MFLNFSRFFQILLKIDEFVDLHRTLECKIHRQNFTRWSSTYLMLLTYFKAYKKGAFKKNVCPQSEEEIKDYLKILTPFHLISKHVQEKSANISVVLPSILVVIHNQLKCIKVEDENQRDFVANLLFFTKTKFDYELNSKKIK